MSETPETPRFDEPGFAGMLRLIQSGRMTRRQVLHRGLAIGLSVPALSALIAACGGDDDDDDGGDEPTDEPAEGGAATEPADEVEPTDDTGGETDATEPADEAGATEPGDDAEPTESGGGASGDEVPINGGTLTILQTGSIPDLDPQSAYDSDASALFFGTYEMLLRLDGSDTFSYVPMLADSWESNEDLTEWSFTIADGITFHDGSPCDAPAVVKSFQRFHEMGLGPVSVISRFVASPEDITAPDANTITFKLIYGTDIFLAAMASQYGPLVVSPTAVEENATDDDPFAHEWFRSNMVGTGPYRVEENILGDHVTLVRFEEFHRGWEGNHFDTIIFRNVVEPATQRQLMEAGEADATTGNLTEEDVVAIEEAGELPVIRYATTNANWIRFNYVRLPDPKVREAFSWAFPYESVRQDVYQGLVTPSSGACTPTTLGYPADGFIYTTDLDKAKQLLDEAGFDYSQSIEFLITAGEPVDQQMAQLYQSSLAEIGVTLEVVEMEEGAFTDLIYGEAPGEERPHFYSSGWWPDYNDAHNEIYPNFHTESITPNGSNGSYYSNATVDELLDASSTMSSGAEYDETIAEINRIMVVEDPAAAFYGSVEWATVLNPAIRGFVPNPIYINTYNLYDMYRVEV